MIRLFDVQNGKVIPSEHCYTLSFLNTIMESYEKEEATKILTYLFYMSCPNPDMNPYFDTPEQDKEELILKDIDADFSVEDPMIIHALSRCRQLYETPTYRAYIGMKSMLDRLATYMEKTPIEHGRDGNITAIVNAASKFEQIRQSFKGTLRDLEEEQSSQVRGGQNLSYDS